MRRFTRGVLSRSFGQSVKLVEVGPRDGLQNIKTILSPESKATYINLLLRSGLRDVEVGSFVSDAVAQMKNTREVLGLIEKPPSANLIALVGNERYAEEAAAYSTVDTLAVFTTISETFCLKNNGCDTQKNLARIKKIAQVASRYNKKLRGYVSCVFGCPFEGYTPEYIARVVDINRKLLDIGCYEVSIADTIGTATAQMIVDTTDALWREGIPLMKSAIHLHDPRGGAKQNLMIALACGIGTVDCATNPKGVVGFGGCPSAPDPSSNIDTLTVLSALKERRLRHIVINQQDIEMAAKYIGECI